MAILKIIIINPKTQMLIQMHFLGEKGVGVENQVSIIARSHTKKIIIIKIREIGSILEMMGKDITIITIIIKTIIAIITIIKK